MNNQKTIVKPTLEKEYNEICKMVKRYNWKELKTSYEPSQISNGYTARIDIKIERILHGCVVKKILEIIKDNNWYINNKVITGILYLHIYKHK